ncbi:MAG: LytR/AlgR family response regulator transcription factor [Acetatifactor sp.]
MERILIVEDDIAQLDFIDEVIRENYPGFSIQKASTYEEALGFIQASVSETKYFSLFLLDIQLTISQADRGGFILAKKIRDQKAYFQVPILFLTALSDECMYALSNYHCYSFITKPYTKEDILFQMEQMMFSGYLNTVFEFIDTDRIRHKIPFSDIVSFTSDKHTLIVCTTNDEYRTRQYSLEKILPILPHDFLQIHKSHVVNRNYLANYDALTRLATVGKYSVPVGKKYDQNLKDLYKDTCL